MNFKRLIVISGPGGVGKGTVIAGLMRTVPGLKLSCSYTTRSPRDGEFGGVHYHFISREMFRGMVVRGEFLEWSKVADNYYGTSKSSVEWQTADGSKVILEIDVRGHRKLWKREARLLEKQKKTWADHDWLTSIFIMPPSLAVLEQRLRERGKDDEETIRRRLLLAQKEMRAYREYDHLVHNDDLEKTIAHLRIIVGQPARV